MKPKSLTGVTFISAGTFTGTVISSTVGGIGIAGSFGAVGIGATTITAMGTVFGAAAYGTLTGIIEGDNTVFGTMGIGAISGLSISQIVGKIGFVAPKIGLAFGIGTVPIVGIGAVLGLASYGVVKLLDNSQFTETSLQLFARMEDKILQNSDYFEALLDLCNDDLDTKFTELEIEAELQELKTKTNFKSEHKKPENQHKILNQNLPLPETWQCVKTLKGHTSNINDIAIHPDNITLVSGSDDRQVKLWNLQTGKLLHTFVGQAEAVLSVAIRPDGKYLISGSVDKKISKWQLETKEYCGILSYLGYPYSHNSFINALVYSQDGKIIISASQDKTIKIWGSYTGKLNRTLNGHKDTVLTIAITADGKTLVSGSADKTIRVWNIETGQQYYIIDQDLGIVNKLVITPDSKNVISACTDGKIKIWNIDNGDLFHTLENHSYSISDIAIHPNGKTLASSSQDGIIKLWNLETRELIENLSGFSPLAFSADGRTLVSGGKNGTIKIWQYVHQNNNLSLNGEWWEILGVEANANYQDVKTAYLKLAKLYHPDLNNSAEAKAAMQAINKAYQKFKNFYSRL
ncbi:MAG: hypothetical protein EAZ76_15360 [Nostocales cyanobacterium]|nr:MAG: hypothetical protein EAZ87_19490 [Nostocales cyanobacterium]TAF11032.1 MAG: hypothetical protein EAZ76_15360 [Nostocales cyanobacterium]